MTIPFKICTGCAKTWESQSDFLNEVNADLCVKGFQADFGSGENSMILFNHNLAHCGTTIAIPVVEFANLMPGYFAHQKPGEVNDCTGSCLASNDLKTCSALNCRNGLVAEFLASLGFGQQKEER
ncbi:MAG: hypothetical protein Kow0037_16140 [Calditrichia bacterium]